MIGVGIIIFGIGLVLFFFAYPSDKRAAFAARVMGIGLGFLLAGGAVDLLMFVVRSPACLEWLKWWFSL